MTTLPAAGLMTNPGSEFGMMVLQSLYVSIAALIPSSIAGEDDEEDGTFNGDRVWKPSSSKLDANEDKAKGNQVAPHFLGDLKYINAVKSRL